MMSVLPSFNPLTLPPQNPPVPNWPAGAALQVQTVFYSSNSNDDNHPTARPNDGQWLYYYCDDERQSTNGCSGPPWPVPCIDGTYDPVAHQGPATYEGGPYKTDVITAACLVETPWCQGWVHFGAICGVCPAASANYNGLGAPHVWYGCSGTTGGYGTPTNCCHGEIAAFSSGTGPHSASHANTMTIVDTNNLANVKPNGPNDPWQTPISSFTRLDQIDSLLPQFSEVSGTVFGGAYFDSGPVGDGPFNIYVAYTVWMGSYSIPSVLVFNVNRPL
jgi:hypothetical protein